MLIELMNNLIIAYKDMDQFDGLLICNMFVGSKGERRRFAKIPFSNDNLYLSFFLQE